ncbi:MAG: hypothetical protein HON98_13445 [Chloroflexi bacterium]|jgi:hypothetical protein|nr:hypothetical protein [Chloroflexota bacterium]MBT3669211.1 hypothetical protein [Chloroflexota bacterium]MBT4003048.1 hypothetical protein [Chloroflexota bacterium]MBT4306456.1 hypothetical protein [Chloroflexota bacterium]MBT4534955.1 hypothetical protein [Chloroflexota bacterium]
MTEPTTYCHNHPGKETGLRCNRCDKYICAQCAVHTPTGYRCKECNREMGKKFNTAQVQDYILVFIVAAVLSYLGSYLTRIVGFFIFFIAPAVGVGIAEVVRRVINRRRSKSLFQLMVVAIVVGAFPSIWQNIYFLFLGAGLQALTGIIWPTLYIFLAASSAYARIAGIQLR